MCEDHWEWEIARRRKPLALEDPQHKESGEDEDIVTGLPETVLPPPTLPEEKKRARPMLAR